MKLYLYEYVGNLTESYHSGGGLVIITDGEPTYTRQGEYLGYDSELGRTEYGPDVEVELPEPTLVLDVPGAEPAVFVFEDAGCC